MAGVKRGEAVKDRVEMDSGLQEHTGPDSRWPWLLNSATLRKQLGFCVCVSGGGLSFSVEGHYLNVIKEGL